MLDPRSVAIVGASDSPDKIGGRPLVLLDLYGYRGRILPINPTRSEVQGLTCYPDISSLPEVPDVAVVVVPGQSAVAAIEELAAAGTQVAVVMTSGFGEVSEQGRAQERHMRQVAGAVGMRIIGPNSMGVANFGTGTVLTFTTALLEVVRQEGSVAVVSQSGSMAVEPYVLLARQGIGVRQVHATGNDSDVTVAEMAALAATDPGVELLLLYLEDVKDAAALAELGRVARARGLPVLALKAGRTPAGAAAARSHTGALANEDRVVDAFLERHGIWRAHDLDDLIRTARLHLRPWRPRGNRIAVMSNSGASCVQSADAAEVWGVELAELSTRTRADLDHVLPSFATTTNPIDLTAALIGNPGLFGGVLSPLARDPSVDAFHLALPIAGRGYDIDGIAHDLAEIAQQRPVVVSCPMPEQITAPFVAHGLALFSTETEAIAALGSYLGQRRRHDDAVRRGDSPFVPVEARPPESMLDEAASLAAIEEIGLPVVTRHLCTTVEETLAAFFALGPPVVVKGCSPTISHKSDLGLVRLGITSPEAAAEAFTSLATTLAGLAGGVSDDHVPHSRVIVARQENGRRELLLGARYDPTFGPVLVVGDGGVHVEAMPDVGVLLAPVTTAEVLNALSRLRIAPLLAGTRGQPPMDIAAYADAAVVLARLIADPSANIASVDLNPVFVKSQGHGCIVADAVIFTSGATK